MASKKANDTSKQRTKMVEKMLSNDPHVVYEDVVKALKSKFGVGFDFYKFRTMKYGSGAAPRPTPAAAPNSVKTELKKDTTPAPQQNVHDFIKDLGPIAQQMGIEKMSMSMVDGKPKWDVTVTERRQFSI